MPRAVGGVRSGDGEPTCACRTGTSAAARCPRTWHRVYGKDTAFIRTLHRGSVLGYSVANGGEVPWFDFRRWPRRVLAPLHIHGAACIPDRNLMGFGLGASISSHVPSPKPRAPSRNYSVTGSGVFSG